MKNLTALSLVLAFTVAAAAQTQNVAGTNQLTINGVGAGATGPINLGISLGGQALLSYSGLPNSPIMLVLSSGAQANAYVIGPNNSIDVNLATLAFFLDGTGAFAPSPLAPYLRTGSTGAMNFIIPNAVTLPGQSFATQGAFLNPAYPAGIQVSAAFNILSPNLQPGTPGCNASAVTVPGLGDDTSSAIDITPSNGANWFTFYGVSYSTMYAGSNGYITGAAYTTLGESVAGLLTAPAKICAWWDDLNPTVGGTFSYYVNDTPGAEIFELCWTNVSEYGTTNQNTIKITLTATTVTFDYGPMASVDGLVGLSPGTVGAVSLPLDLSVSGNGVPLNQGATVEAPNELFTATFQNDMGGSKLTWSLGVSGGGVQGTPVFVN